MSRDYKEPLDTAAPMAAARMVRRDKFAWPGGYALALVTTDGGLLCPACVAAEFSLISSAHRDGRDCGWRPAGIACEANTDDEGTCDHCNAQIWESKE